MISNLTHKTYLALLLAIVIGVAAFGAETVPADPIGKVPDVGSAPWKNIEAKITGDVDITFAEGFGPFVMIGRNKAATDSRQLWNLAEQKQISTITGKFDIDKHFTLSPDAKYFAAWRGHFAADKIAIFDQKGKPFAELKNATKVEGLQFLANGNLASFGLDNVTIWDVTSKKSLKTFTIPRRSPLARYKPTFSPNGKFYLAALKNVITVLDDAGKELAKFNCPKVDDFFESEVIGVACHPDGKTLAVYLNTIKKNGFCLLDVTTGLFKGPFELEQPAVTFGTEDRVIEWSPDGKAVVLRNRYVADAESGKVIWSFPEGDGGLIPVALPIRMFAINRGIYSVKADKFAIKSVSHDDAKIAELLKAARSGVKVSDLSLPKLMEVTLANVKSATSPAAGVAWTGKPDPAGDTSKLPKAAIALDAKADQVDAIFFTPPSAGLVFLDLRSGGGFRFPTMPGQVDKTKSKGVDVFRLSDGLRAGKLDFAFPARFKTASLDGKFVVVTDPETHERLDVLNVEKGEPVCAFKPFHEEGQNKRVTFVRYVGDGKLLTGNGTRYVVWTIPDGKAETQLLVKPHVAALSANAKLLAIAEADSLRILDAATLGTLGDLEIPIMNQIRREIKAVTFHPDGKSLAASYNVTFKDNSIGSVIAVWDLTTGKSSIGGWTPGYLGGPFGNSSIEFAGKDHFLLNGTQLLSGKRNEIVWSIHASHQMRMADNSPDGRFWYIARTEPFKEGGSLVSVDIAESMIHEWVKIIETAPTVLWRAGATVAVNVQVANAPNAQKSLETVLANQGMKIGSGYATLTVSATERATGKQVKYRDLFPSIGQGLGEQTVNVVEVVCVAQLAINGTVIWQGNNLYSNSGGSIVNLPPNETDVGAHLSRSMWNGVASWAGSVTPPKLIVQTRDGILALPGMATFTAKGIEVQPPVIRVNKQP